MKWYREEDEKEYLDFKEKAIISMPYTGLGEGFRTRVKCALLVSIMLSVANAILLVSGMRQGKLLYILGGIMLVCTWILIKTRTKTFDKWINAALIYTERSLRVYNRNYYTGYTNGIPCDKEVLYTINYEDITDIEFHRREQSIEITGEFKVEIRNQSSLDPEYRDVYTIDCLVIKPEEKLVKKILDGICRNSNFNPTNVIET